MADARDQLKQDAQTIKFLMREPAWQLIDRQLEAHEQDAINRLITPATGGFSDDYYRGVIATIRFIRYLPERILQQAGG